MDGGNAASKMKVHGDGSVVAKRKLLRKKCAEVKKKRLKPADEGFASVTPGIKKKKQNNESLANVRSRLVKKRFADDHLMLGGNAASKMKVHGDGSVVAKRKLLRKKCAEVKKKRLKPADEGFASVTPGIKNKKQNNESLANVRSRLVKKRFADDHLMLNNKLSKRIIRKLLKDRTQTMKKRRKTWQPLELTRPQQKLEVTHLVLDKNSDGCELIQSGTKQRMSVSKRRCTISGVREKPPEMRLEMSKVKDKKYVKSATGKITEKKILKRKLLAEHKKKLNKNGRANADQKSKKKVQPLPTTKKAKKMKPERDKKLRKNSLGDSEKVFAEDSASRKRISTNLPSELMQTRLKKRRTKRVKPKSAPDGQQFLKNKEGKTGRLTKKFATTAADCTSLSTVSSVNPPARENNPPVTAWKPGSVHKGFVTCVKGLYLKFKLDFSTQGRIHISQIEDKVRQGSCPLSRFRRHQPIQVILVQKSHQTLARFTTHSRRIKVWDCKLLQRSYDDDQIGFPTEFEVGQKVPAFVTSVTPTCAWMTLAPGVNNGKVYAVNLSHKLWDVLHSQKHFKKGQGYMTTIIKKTKSFYSLSIVDPEYLAIGAVVVAQVLALQHDWGLTLRLPCNYRGRVHLTDTSDDYHSSHVHNNMEQKLLRCYILSVDHESRWAIVSLRPSRILKILTNVVDKEIASIDDLHENDEVRGYVSGRRVSKVYVTVGRNIDVVAAIWPEVPRQFLVPGNVVKVRVTKIMRDANKVVGNLLIPDDAEMTEFLECSTDDLPKNSKKSKAHSWVGSVSEDLENMMEEPPERQFFLNLKPVVIKSSLEKQDNSAPHLNVSSGFVWDEKSLLLNPQTIHGSSSSSDDSEDDEKTSLKHKQKRKRISDQLAEQQLFEREKLLMDGTRLPETVDDYDRLVLSSPNSSLIWLKYMTFHLHSAEIEKARIVGERALKTISFREEQEKLNVWLALLNLENLYGTPESLNETFQRALQYNDPLTIYNRLVNIYIKTNKLGAAEQLYKIMVKKFSQNKDVWINFGVFLMRNGQHQSAQKLMEQSLKSLSVKEHVGVISKFAQMEFKLGEAQRGKTMLESILSSYPRRTDIWSVYFDMVASVEGNLEEARQLFERAVSMQLSAKKMKFFFKRYLEFEKKHGTEASVNRVQWKAAEYVESRDRSMEAEEDEDR